MNDLDRWVSESRFTYPKETGHLIRWAVARGHARGLTFDQARWEGARGPYDTEKRWDDARRLLHDGTVLLPDRVAGLLLLLYAYFCMRLPAPRRDPRPHARDHIHAAVQWQKAASGDWMAYAADLRRRHPGSLTETPP